MIETPEHLQVLANFGRSCSARAPEITQTDYVGSSRCSPVMRFKNRRSYGVLRQKAKEIAISRPHGRRRRSIVRARALCRRIARLGCRQVLGDKARQTSGFVATADDILEFVVSASGDVAQQGSAWRKSSTRALFRCG